jgi:hypothetical protein
VATIDDQPFTVGPAFPGCGVLGKGGYLIRPKTPSLPA